MLFTATTLKDSPDNVGFFVAANLASGVDHMFVFLDAPNAPDQRAVAESLAEHPHVTCIATSREHWWHSQRPASLNVRQRTNANWARAVLEPFGREHWLFHIDGDEVACLDREAMSAVPDETNAVWLAPWEAVSQWSASVRPTQFKRLLDEPDLHLLHVLGRIPEASNQAYFHGHVMGKSGVRPASGLGLTLHGAVDADGRRPPRHEDERLKVLHYDAPSGEEFVRKWTALASAGPARYRASRAPVAQSLRRLAGLQLSEDVRRGLLREIFERTTEDDVETLSALGLLAVVDPLEPTNQTPQQLDAVARAELTDRVADLAEGPKDAYFIADPEPSARDRAPHRLSRRLNRRLAGLTQRRI